MCARAPRHELALTTRRARPRSEAIRTHGVRLPSSSSNFAFGSVGLCADLARIDGGEVPAAVDLRRPNDMSSSKSW